MITTARMMIPMMMMMMMIFKILVILFPQPEDTHNKCKAQAFALSVLGRWKRKIFPQRKTIVCDYML